MATSLVSSLPTWSLYLLIPTAILITTRLTTGLARNRIQTAAGDDEGLKPVPVLPYWVPYLGHAVQLAWSFEGVARWGRDISQDGIFSLKILGKDHIMVVMPSLVKQYFLQRPTTLSNDDFITFIHDRYFGDGGEAARMHPDDFHTIHRTLNTLMKEPFLSTATDSMTELIQKSISNMFTFSAHPAKQLHWERLSGAVPDGTSVTADLFPLTMNYVGDIAGEVIMGHALFANFPHVLDDLWVFDDSFNALLTGAPAVTRRLSLARAARARLNAAFAEWNAAMQKTLRGEDPGHAWRDMSDVSEMMRVRLRALSAVGASAEHDAVASVAVYWGLLVNANKISFWLLLHIISDTELLAAVRAEIAPFARTSEGKDEGVQIDAVGLVKKCPLFKAAFYETMRLYTAGTSYKKVLQPVTLTESAADAELWGKTRPQSYRIPAGSFLVIPHAAMQTDDRLWADPERFDPRRFLAAGEGVSDSDLEARGRGESREAYIYGKDTTADLKHLNPFGGGHSVCKGRTFAEREVLLFVAAWLTVWEFSPADGGGWRIPGKVYNGTGSASPTGQPVRVRVRRRMEKVDGVMKIYIPSEPTLIFIP